MKQTLRNLIADGKTKQVLDQLRQLNLADTDLSAEVVQLAARFSQYERQHRMGVEDPSVLGIELRKINSALLSVIERLEEGENTPSVFSPLRKRGCVISITVALAAFIGVIVNFRVSLMKPNETDKSINVTVYVEDKKSDLISALKKEAYVLMTTSGGGLEKELIDDKGRASFQNIKVGDKVRLNVDFSEPYRPLNPDLVYVVPADGRIYLTVGLQNLNRVFGTVIYHDQPLAGVKVVIGDLTVMTDSAGSYKIQIPEQDQRKEQEVKFLKTGYKMLMKKAFPQTNEPLNVIMEK